jgi:N-acetylglucosaminyldiphosphoundecaprenol N-acetyl-beta-D-mannosaminyltransferase
MTLQSEDILGYQVCMASVGDVVKRVTSWLEDSPRECRYFACLNPHSAEVANSDITFHNSLISANFLTPDGIGVVYASRMLGGQIRQRVTGMDVFLGIAEAMDGAKKGRFFFLGSTEETLDKIREEMASRFPHVVVAGTYSPPFKPEFSAEDNRQMIEAINASYADVLWVGLTAPKQEKWIFENREHLNVGFAGPVGAVFDMFAGNIKRVGSFWQNLGFEWLPRLVQEPKRLWRRSLVSAPKFLLRTLAYRYRK